MPHTSSTVERVPQAERTAATRARLMMSTVDVLVELGWSRTSTTVVCARAGVSRGAMLHHFPTKQALVVAAVEHLAQLRRSELQAAARQGQGQTRAVLEILSGMVTSPVFLAALELWVAARSDPQLRKAVAPLERRLGRETHSYAVELLGVDDSIAQNRRLVQATLDLVRGLGLANSLNNDAARRVAVLDSWAEILDRELVTT